MTCSDSNYQIYQGRCQRTGRKYIPMCVGSIEILLKKELFEVCVHVNYLQIE